MKKKCDEYSKKYNLNFTLIATEAEKISSKFAKLDRAIYGKRKGITDKEHYTNSFYIPESTKISVENKVKLEAPYHAYTNGGHITYVSLGSLKENKAQELMKVLKIMKEQEIGYGAIIN